MPEEEEEEEPVISHCFRIVFPEMTLLTENLTKWPIDQSPNHLNKSPDLSWILIIKIMCLVVCMRSIWWHSCNILAFTTHDNLISHTLCRPFYNLLHFICQTYREISDKGAVTGGRVAVLYVVQHLVDMSHDRYGSYWKLPAVWSTDGKCKRAVVKLLRCENTGEVNRPWLVHGLWCCYAVPGKQFVIKMFYVGFGWNVCWYIYIIINVKSKAFWATEEILHDIKQRSIEQLNSSPVSSSCVATAVSSSSSSSSSNRVAVVVVMLAVVVVMVAVVLVLVVVVAAAAACSQVYVKLQ